VFFGKIYRMKIIGKPIFSKEADGTLSSRIGTIFFNTLGLVTERTVHAMQRMMWIDALNNERAALGKEPLSEEEEREELLNSVDLIFTEDEVLIRPDPTRMDLAFKADEELQKILSKRHIRFLNAHSTKVRNALITRGENWRMTRTPISQEDMANLINGSRVAISGENIYYYNRTTGTRYLTVEGAAKLSNAKGESLRAQLSELQTMLSRRNRIGHPEVAFFPVTTPLEIKERLLALKIDALSDVELKAKLAVIDSMWRASVPSELRDESVDNFSWRNEMCRTLTTGPNDTGADEFELIQGISPEFYRQIEWLPGVRIDGMETVFDPLWEEFDRTHDPELAQICDQRARNILLNVSRFYGDVEYVNIGRISRSLARTPIVGSRRGNVYIIQFKEKGETSVPKVKIIRFQKWGIAAHLDEGKDLLRSIIETNEYTDYIIDRRLMCQQLGMNLPRHFSYGEFPEIYTGTNVQYRGTRVRASYFTRSYIPGIASDKIPPVKFRNPAFAKAFARLMGEAAAIDLIVGRRSSETGENLFDKNFEVLQMDRAGIPERLIVTDHGGSFVNYIHNFCDVVAPYANVMRRRKEFVSDYNGFVQEYLTAFEGKIGEIQKKYLSSKRAFDCLFASRHYDAAGSGAYRWSKILERLSKADAKTVRNKLEEAIMLSNA
jgi:hypothetical protein